MKYILGRRAMRPNMGGEPRAGFCYAKVKGEDV
jgi:hypothetical protein